jgi:hypothetical protein
MKPESRQSRRPPSSPGFITFGFTMLPTITGVGAAFILIPVFCSSVF